MTVSKGIDSYRLKLTALIFMLLDHICSELNVPAHTRLGCPLWPQWIPVITRFVSPLFLYLMVEGFYHTRSRIKYLRRLFIAGAVMMGGNVLINWIFHNVSSATGKYTFRSLIEGHDIFLTLAVRIFLAIVTALSSIVLEGGFYLVPLAFIFWFFHNSKPLQCVGTGIWSLVLLALALISYSGSGTTLYTHLCFDNEWAMITVIPFILVYNGERGKNTKFTKYLFYVIYPLHLWILMILRFIIE